VKKLYILIAILFLTGCSAKFAYRNIDWLVYWYLDEYIELTDEQQDVFEVKLNKWLDWHKQNELPKYVSQLDLLAQDIIDQNISAQRIDYHRDEARAHWVRLRAYITPDLVQMAPMLSPEQITYLFAALEKENLERQEELDENAQDSANERTEDRLKRTLKETKRWLGKLTTEQETMIENTLPQFHSNGTLWLEYRRAYQNQLRALFAQPDRGSEFAQSLSVLLTQPEQFRSQALQIRNDENSNAYVNMLLTLAVLSTEKQRQHVKKEISEFSKDLTDLMN